MLGAIVRAYNTVLQVMRVLSGIVIFCVFLLIVIDVSVRMIGISPWTYSSGVVEYGLLWFAMLAAPHLARTKGHVYIDAITQLLPPRPQKVLANAAYTICIVSSLMVFWFSLDLLIEAFLTGQIDTRGEDMPLWTLLLPIPICFLMMAVEFGRFLLGFDSMYGERTDVRDTI